MRPIVLATFRKFTRELEGDLPWMYLDRIGVVTTGDGNALFSPDAALTLQWIHPEDGSVASRDEVVDAWHTVHTSGIPFEEEGGGSKNFQRLTSIRLSPASITQLVDEKLAENENIIIKQFPGFLTWPAYAQMAILSMSWARGPNGFLTEYPKFSAALNRVSPRFDVAAAESNMKGVGIEKRNAENRIMFENAAKIVQGGGDFDQLDWPISTLGPITRAITMANKVSLGFGLVGAVGYGVYRLIELMRKG